MRALLGDPVSSITSSAGLPARSLSAWTSSSVSQALHPRPRRNEVVQLIAFAERKPPRHRLNALAIARADQPRYVERTHLAPRLVPQPIQKRLGPTSKLVFPIQRPANHGRPPKRSDLDYLPDSHWTARRHLEKRDREQIM